MASPQLDRITVTLEMGLWAFLRENTLTTLVDVGSPILSRGSWAVGKQQQPSTNKLVFILLFFSCACDVTTLFGLPLS